MSQKFNIEYIKAMHGEPRVVVRQERFEAPSFSKALRHAREYKKVLMHRAGLANMKIGRFQFTFKGSETC